MNDFDNEILPTDPDEGEEIAERVAGRETYEWVRSLVGAVLAITLLFTFVVRLMGVSGHSMVPTLQDGDRLIVVSGWLCGDYKYGDIVIAYKESFDAEPIVKRVIATEGQTVDIDFTLGRVFVDGELLQEDYVNDLTYLDEGTQFPLTLGEGELFLMGDNRNRSSDSRDERLGAVDERLIIGKAVLLVSLELDEVMTVSDRILVMYEGKIVGELDPKQTTVEELGLYMAGAKKEAKEQ